MTVDSPRFPTDEFLETAARFQVDVPPEAAAPLIAYFEQLLVWNERLNLTRHCSLDDFVGRDLVDCQALSSHLQTGDRVLDVGSGGGVPGAPLAILRPDVTVELCDSVAKKAAALKSIVEAAGVDATAHHARAETLVEESWYDALVARAVAPLEKVARWFAPHWDDFGGLFIIKGPSWIDERHAARTSGLLKGVELRRVGEYPRAGMDANSVVLRLRRDSEEE